jgi:hypothetical protein
MDDPDGNDLTDAIHAADPKGIISARIANLQNIF